MGLSPHICQITSSGFSTHFRKQRRRRHRHHHHRRRRRRCHKAAPSQHNARLINAQRMCYKIMIYNKWPVPRRNFIHGMDVCLHIIRANIRNNWEWRHIHTLINEEISQNSRRPGNTWRAHGTRRLISWRRSGRGENTSQHPNQTREKLRCLSYCDAQGDKLGAGRGSSHGSGHGSGRGSSPGASREISWVLTIRGRITKHPALFG